MKRLFISIILTMLVLFGLRKIYYFPNDVVSPDLLYGLDYKLFMVLLVCSYMFIHKLVFYLGDLKIKESYSRIDIVFMFFVFLFLFFPMSHINHGTISKRENRNLATYHNFIENGRINYSYGKQFEEWFNDRFNQRDWFVWLNGRINRVINGKQANDKALIGQQGWLYTKQYRSVEMFQNDNLFSETELEQIVANLDKMNAWCNKHGMKFYLFFTPDKETIYPEFYAKGYGKVNDISRMQQVVDYLSKHSNIKFTYPYDDLMKAKQRQILYYKTGTHWNDTGAYIGYQDMFKMLKKDFPSLKMLQPKDFNIVEKKHVDDDLARMLAIDAYKDYAKKDIVNEMYEVKVDSTVLDDRPYLRGGKNIGSISDFTNKDKSKKLKAIFYTDSFFVQIKTYVAQSFGRMINIFVGYGKDFDMEENRKLFDEVKPDIFVMMTTERFLQRLVNLQELGE